MMLVMYATFGCWVKHIWGWGREYVAQKIKVSVVIKTKTNMLTARFIYTLTTEKRYTFSQQ
jgi:hypothetical protein